jgi:hypothetical protein
MNHLGDFPVGATVDLMWNSNGANGASITRATDGTIKIYKNNSVTERSSAAGITDTEDFDANTGVHHLRISLSDNTDSGFYSAGSEYHVVLTAATIDGQTVNAHLASFSIERASGILAEIKRRLPDAAFNAAGGLSSMVHRASTLPAQTGANPAVGTVNLAAAGIGATDELVGQLLVMFSTGITVRGVGIITAADNANDRVTLNGGTALTFTPTAGDIYVVRTDPGLAGLASADVASAVLDAVAASYNAAGSIGEAINNAAVGGEDPSILVSTTIATLASQTSFTLTAGSADNNAYVDAIAVVTDSVTAVQKAVGWVSAYTGSTKTVTLAFDPAIFTMAVGDSISIISAPKRLAASAIAAASFQASAIDANAIASNAIAAAKIATGAITNAKFAAGAIDNTAIAANAIAATNIATGAITAAKFAAGAIDAAAIADNAIDAGAIATGAITAAKFAAGAIDAAAIATDAITAAKIAADAIGASELAADAATEIVTAVFARAFSAAYGSYTFDQMIGMFSSVLISKVSGMETGLPVFRNPADSGNVVSAVTDADGNRTSVTRTP